MSTSPEILIRLVDPSLPEPAYQTPGAVAFDLCARTETKVVPGQLARVPLNVAVKLPDGHCCIMAARSSLHKRGLALINGIGVFDQDFSGNDDEYQAVVTNFTQDEVVIERGERIVQLLVLPYSQFPIRQVTSLDGPNRGGFGTTGKK